MKWISMTARPEQEKPFLALYLPEKTVCVVKPAPYFKCGFAEVISGLPMSAPDMYIEIPEYDL